MIRDNMKSNLQVQCVGDGCHDAMGKFTEHFHALQSDWLKMRDFARPALQTNTHLYTKYSRVISRRQTGDP